MTLTRKIAHNTIIQIIGKTAGIGFSLLTVALMTRYLGMEGFGYYTTAFAFLQVFGILFDFGLQMTTVSMISDPQYEEQKILGNILGLRLVSALILLGIVPIIALFFPYPLIIKQGIFIMSITFLFSSLTAILTGIFQKYLSTQKAAVADLVQRILMFILMFLAVYFQLSLFFIFIFTTVASAAHFFLLANFAKQYAIIKFRFQISEWRKIISKTWPIALTIALNLVYFKSDTIILSIYRSQAEVGIYGAPYRVLEVLINLAYLFLGLLLPLMAGYYAAKKIDDLKNILQQGFNVMAIAIPPLIFGTYFLGVPLMTLIAGKEFAISGELLKILMLATGAIFIAALFGYAIVASDCQKQMIKFYFINAVISLTAYLIFIPKYSYWAAAWLTVFTEVFVLVTAFWVVYKNLKFAPKLNIFYKSIFSSAVMGVLLYFFSGSNLFLLLAVSGIIYFSVMYLVKGISKSLLVEIFNKK